MIENAIVVNPAALLRVHKIRAVRFGEQIANPRAP